MEQTADIAFIAFPAGWPSYLLFVSSLLYVVVLIIGWRRSRWLERGAYIFLAAAFYACSVQINADTIGAEWVRKDPERVVAEQYDTAPSVTPPAVEPFPVSKPRRIYPIGSGKRDF